jgi:hypothetical protein
MVWLEAAISSVVPSGFDRATAVAPTAPPAPARFSMMMVSPSRVASSGAITRARTSCPPPGAKGTMILVTGVCACARWTPATSATRTNASRLIKIIIVSCPLIAPGLVAGSLFCQRASDG